MKFIQLIASLIMITLLTFVGVLYVHYNQIVIIPHLDTLPIPGIVKTALTNPSKNGEEGEEDQSKVQELQSSTQEVQSQLYTLSDRSGKIGGHVQQVLGAFIEKREAAPDEDKDSVQIHQQAFEYGRYLYCQQIIKEYEGQNTIHTQQPSQEQSEQTGEESK